MGLSAEGAQSVPRDEDLAAGGWMRLPADIVVYNCVYLEHRVQRTKEYVIPLGRDQQHPHMVLIVT